MGYKQGRQGGRGEVAHGQGFPGMGEAIYC